MRVWRISQREELTGEGGHHVHGRWHTKPRSILYAAEHPALAMAETMAHMGLSVISIPRTLKLLEIEVADEAPQAPRPQVADGWQANEITTQAIGNEWLDANTSLLMPVPSVLVPSAINYLINPRHASAADLLRLVSCRPFWFDQRYLR